MAGYGSIRSLCALRARVNRPGVEYAPWSVKVETLLLDAGGVLVNPNFERVADALRAHGVPAEGALLRGAEARAKKELDTGAAVNATNDAARGWLYFELVLKHAGITRDAGTAAALQDLAAYHAEHNLWETVPEEVPGALERLRAGGRRLVVLSNSNGTVGRLFARLGLAGHFDYILDSWVEKVEKPDLRFFTLALERSAADPATTLHVGDLYHVDVLGARAAGLEAWLFDVAGLYPEADCPRVGSLMELAARLAAAS
jgi:HAD superfamily hydrolase (TIGR01509 family)